MNPIFRGVGFLQQNYFVVQENLNIRQTFKKETREETTHNTGGQKQKIGVTKRGRFNKQNSGWQKQKDWSNKESSI